MSKGAGQVQETARERALSDYAVQQLQDYNQRWLPVQKNLAAQVEAMGQPDSAARRLATGRAATDTGIKFAGAQQKLQSSMADNVGLGSSRAKLGVAGLGDDEARSKGLGMTAADQQITDSYVKSLTALTAIGRGEKSTVANGLAQQAQSSARQAQADAEAALTERMGTAGVIGQAGGLALQQTMKKDNSSSGNLYGIAAGSGSGSGLSLDTPTTQEWGAGVQGTGLYSAIQRNGDRAAYNAANPFGNQAKMDPRAWGGNGANW